MKKPMKKNTKLALGALVFVTLLGVCFLCVGIYAKREFQKEKSWLPQKLPAQKPSVTQLPDNAHDAYEYAMRLYHEALRAETAEGSWHTDVNLDGDLTLPFSETDNAIVGGIIRGAAGEIRGLYPNASGVKMAEAKPADLPEIDLKEADILEYVYDPAVVFNRRGEYSSDTYELVFRVDPAAEDTDAILSGDVYAGIRERLRDALTVNDVKLDVQSVEVRFRIDRLTDHMMNASVTRAYTVTADVSLAEDYAALLPDAGTNSATVILPYRATEQIDFFWYGLRFTEDYIEQKPDDIVTLPLEIRVNGASVQGEDFTVTYTVSDPETMEIDADGTLTVLKVNGASDTEGVTITATLDYEGRTYTDDLTVYVTALDKTTTGVRFYEDAFTLGVGSTARLPADVRVPVNEAAESRREEEYELICVTSAPDALKAEADGKDIYVTALKTTDAPVTVSVTMHCGGHTYFAEIPVTITKGTEAENNG